MQTHNYSTMVLNLVTVVACSMTLFLLSEAEEFNFMTESQELLDGDKRIRGIRSSENKDFVLGFLFSVHEEAPKSQDSDCGKVRIGLEVEAMLYAIDKINADSDLLPGVELGYDIRDSCNSETIGLDEAFHLLTVDNPSGATCSSAASVGPSNGTTYPRVFGIVGAENSKVSVPVALVGRLFQMPQISYASTTPLLSDRKKYSYFRRTVPPDDLQVLAIVAILSEFNWTFVSILYSEDSYGSAGRDEFVKVAPNERICIDLNRGIPQSPFDSGFKEDIKADLGHSKANIVVFFASKETVRDVMTIVSGNKTLKTKFTWIASDGWANEIDLIHKFNETAIGVFAVAPLTEYQSDFDNYVSRLTVMSNKRNKWFPEFYAAFANCALEENCDGNRNITSFPKYEQGGFVPMVMDAVYAFAHALHNFLTENCNATNTSAPFVWSKNNGKCLGQSRELNGSSLLEFIDKVNFTSITNNSITFDNKTGSVQGSYRILNYQLNGKDYHFVPVGSWVSGELNILSHKDLQFGLNSDTRIPRIYPVASHCGKCGPGTYVREVTGSCCALCEPCLGQNYSSKSQAKECNNCLTEGEREMWGNSPFSGSNSCVLIPETSATYRDPWAIPSLIIACIGLLFVVATTIIFGLYWKTPIVKSSGREQMILLLIGITSSFILPFFYVAPPSIPICLVNRLGIWFCYSLMFGALAIKVQRVARIFYGVKRNIHYTPRFATPIYQVLFTTIIVVIQMIPIIISLGFVHPKLIRTLRYGNDSESHLGLPDVVITCQKEAIAVIILSLFYETCIITAATILGAFSFKFPKNFNEAKYICFCTFSLLVVWLGLIPTYFTTESRPEVQNAAISLFISMSAFGVLCFIFGPKLYIIVIRPEKNHLTTLFTDSNYPKKQQDQNTSQMKQQPKSGTD